jgi:hypothetical protein
VVAGGGRAGLAVLGRVHDCLLRSPDRRTASKVAIGVLVLAFLWTALNAQREIGELQGDPKLSPRLNWLGDILAIAVGVLFVAPAIAYGVLVVKRGWMP